jgi:hypothetical protein
MKQIKLYICLFLLVISCSSLESEQYILSNLDNIKCGLPKETTHFHSTGQILITYPKQVKSSLPLIMIFGGINYATPMFMMHNTPQIYFEKAILVFLPCKLAGGLGYKFYKRQVDNFIRNKNLAVESYSVCGFSGGGPDVLSITGEKLHIIGLIDVVPAVPTLKLTFDKIINEYNKENWHDNSFYGKQTNYSKFTEFANWTKKEGGYAIDNSVKHELFPKYFFYRYRKVFLN